MITDRMTLSETVKERAYKRSGGQCECSKTGHGHFGRCDSMVTRYGAQFHLKDHGEIEPTLSSVEVLCLFCFRQTAAQSRS